MYWLGELVHIAKKNMTMRLCLSYHPDHLIKFNKMFLRTLQEACEVAVKGEKIWLPLVYARLS